MTGPTLFDRPAPLTPRQQLLKREAELLAEYRSAGGERREELDRALIDLRAQLRLMPKPASPAPATTFVPRRLPGGVRDGRAAAAGDN